MKVSYVLTAFSPSMFGDRATAHIRVIDQAEATALVDDTTQIVATRVSHERLAKAQFPGASDTTARYAMLKLGMAAILIHYRGPQVPDSGEMPAAGMVTFYLIETAEYQEPE